MTTLAYQSDPARKAGIMAAMRADIAADRLVKGQYWQHSKGCAIGCLVHGSSHDDAADLVGMPIEIAGLFDAIFEGLPNGEAQAWPVDFLDAIQPGADLSLVWPRWAHWLLTEEIAAAAAKDQGCAKAVADVAALLAKWIENNQPAAAARWTEAARAAAGAAARWATGAACAAARWATGAAGAAARAPEAAEAARAPEAAEAARAPAAAWAAARTARAASYQRQADKLLALLRSAPVPTS